MADKLQGTGGSQDFEPGYLVFYDSDYVDCLAGAFALMILIH
jgi:hypothetical protein